MFKKIFKKIALSMILLVAISSVSALQVDELQYQPNVIHPGDDVDVWIKVTNDNYDDEVKDIVVEISPHYPFELRQVNPIKGKATISHLNPGEADTVHFKLHVDENAPSRDYRIDVKVSYDEVDDEDTHHYEFTKIYYIHVYGIASFELKINDTSINPGTTKNIMLMIKNVGTGNAKYLNIYLTGNEKINILGGSSAFIRCLSPDDEYMIPLNVYAVPEVENGIYSINAKLTWIGEDGNNYDLTIPLNLKVVKKIYENQPYIYLDDVKNKRDYVEITIGIANRGSSKIKHCVMTLNVNENNYTRYIGDLDEDDYDTLIFEIDDFGNISIKAAVTYFDDYHNQYNITKTFNVYVEKTETQKTVNPIYLIVGAFFIIIIVLYIRKRKRYKELEEI
ncbi:COG1361 S-layer family protein [Methanocaldococcus fervens]|uniref:S-layer domain protein-like protein n=1 Tax=Methanocaldococcus fervens (strain DSM 4213 / JCM 15782 / AG86) TaxID=573064 RepID=C7P682_METFA|nr:COG1361 S-layer family protein [Methanocaldococcus fervens]ACV24064.1 S-layer domain protein-like protein [Methanocaldococcus fervens AG86]